MKNSNSKKLGSSDYFWRVEVHSHAHLDNWITDYLSGMTVTHEKDGTTQISGELSDMSAVYGLIMQMRDYGVTILSLKIEREER